MRTLIFRLLGITFIAVLMIVLSGACATMAAENTNIVPEGFYSTAEAQGEDCTKYNYSEGENPQSISSPCYNPLIPPNTPFVYTTEIVATMDAMHFGFNLLTVATGSKTYYEWDPKNPITFVTDPTIEVKIYDVYATPCTQLGDRGWVAFWENINVDSLYVEWDPRVVTFEKLRNSDPSIVAFVDDHVCENYIAPDQDPREIRVQPGGYAYINSSLPIQILPEVAGSYNPYTYQDAGSAIYVSYSNTPSGMYIQWLDPNEPDPVKAFMTVQYNWCVSFLLFDNSSYRREFKVNQEGLLYAIAC